MSNVVEVYKNIDIEIKGKTISITVPIIIQVDFVRDEETNDDLEFELESDRYGDLQIYVKLEKGDET